MSRLLTPTLALAVVSLAMAQELPNPYARGDEPTIGPAPVPVMEQMFWVQLKLDAATPVEVTAPEGVTLLDRTKPGQGGGWTRLYFRADRGIADGEIVLTPAGAAPIRVPLTVRTYREDIEHWVQQVPGVDPGARKRGRSYYSDEMLATAQANLAAHPELAEGIQGRTRYDSMTDEAIFAALPSWSVPRQCYSNWECPYCGEAIFRHSGFYPWRANNNTAWKLQCPDCERWFPTNDWAADDFTSGEHPDDGWGFPLGEAREDHAGWVAYYNHHQLWQNLGAELRRLSLRHLLFDDREAAHRLGLLLARIAYVYPGMNMRWQQVDDHYLRAGRLLVDGNWERGSVLVPACEAYDAVWEALGEDQALADFLHQKDPSINTPDDVRALIDTYMVQVFGFDWLRRELSGGNMGARETDLAYMAVCANMGPVSDRWIEELFTHAYSSGLNKGGFDDETLINTMTREGPVWIAALGYAYGYLNSKSAMAEILARVPSERWGARCNLYDEAQYPKLRAEFDAWPNMTVAGQFAPNYGDSGSASGGTLGARYPNGIVAHLRQEYLRAWRRWPTDAIAQALYRAGRPPIDLFEPDVWDQVVAQAEAAGPAAPLTSRVMDGVGFVFLESRANAEDVNDRAGLALRYGYGRGHHHHDNLNVELFALGQDMTPELGYPCWAHPMGNTSFVAHHITGMIDRQGQYQSAISHGTLEAFAGAPEASFADVSAAPDGFPNRFYRRALCLADAPGGNVYVLDVLRLAGGTTRTWCFHGPPVGDFESSLSFGAPGEALAVGDLGRGLANNIIEPQGASADGDVSADWGYLDQPLRLRVDLLGAAGRQYITARCAKPDIPPLRYLFAEDEGEDGASEFVSVWQPYQAEAGRFIERIERLPVEGDAGEDEYAPVAVRVTLVGGQVDTFVYSLDPDAELRVGDLEFSGTFGYWSELDGTPRAAHLVGGRYLRKGGEGLAIAMPRPSATVTRVDLAARTITLDAPLAGAQVGQVIYLQGGPHRTAYHVAEVLDGAARLRLDLDSMIFRSKLESFAEDGSHLVSELPPSIEASRGFKPGYYDGALLTGEDLRARYRVDHVEGEQIFTDRPLDPADFPDADGDGRATLRIYDHGPGDTATIIASAFRRWE